MADKGELLKSLAEFPKYGQQKTTINCDCDVINMYTFTHYYLYGTWYLCNKNLTLHMQGSDWSEAVQSTTKGTWRKSIYFGRNSRRRVTTADISHWPIVCFIWSSSDCTVWYHTVASLPTCKCQNSRLGDFINIKYYGFALHPVCPYGMSLCMHERYGYPKLYEFCCVWCRHKQRPQTSHELSRLWSLPCWQNT